MRPSQTASPDDRADHRNVLLTGRLPAHLPAACRVSADPRRWVSDAQVLTTALLATRYFSGRYRVAQRYMEQHWEMKHLDKMWLW